MQTTAPVSSKQSRTSNAIFLLSIICFCCFAAEAKVTTFRKLILQLPATWSRNLLQRYQAAANADPNTGPYGQFTPILNRTQVYGSWGGRWGYTPASSIRGIRLVHAVPSAAPSSSSSSSRLASGTVGATTYYPSNAAYTSQTKTAGASQLAHTRVQTSTLLPASSSGGSSGNSNPSAAGSGVTAPSSSSSSPIGTANAALPVRPVSAAAAAVQPSGVAAVAPSTPPAGTTGGILAAADSTLPQGFTIPANAVNINAGVVTTQATAFAGGFCVPRQSYIVVNTTAVSCNPGSNITQWDGQPICARIDCEKQLDNNNILAAASFCRTVVEPAQFYCPDGCELITQTLRNTTANTTQPITRCACRAGNQPCPGSYVGCVCQPAFIANLNASTSFLVCGLQQIMCENYCSATAGKLGPLCPIQPDSTLPGQISTGENALTGPTYPRWSWDLASQGQATAAVAPGTPVGRRLLKSQWRGINSATSIAKAWMKLLQRVRIRRVMKDS